MSEPIIMFDSEEAATFQTVQGWVSRTGRFYGADENLARYDGSTHRVCNCGALMEKQYTLCAECRYAAAVARYHARPKCVWDDTAWLYSEELDQFFETLDDAQEYVDAANEQDAHITLQDLRLVICSPVMGRLMDEDFFCDELGEDGDLPYELDNAINTFNAVVRAASPLSWEPGKYALDLEDMGRTPPQEPK